MTLLLFRLSFIWGLAVIASALMTPVTIHKQINTMGEKCEWIVSSSHHGESTTRWDAYCTDRGVIGAAESLYNDFCAPSAKLKPT
ncbi:hypothetical protein PRIPAC_71328 [Pristionchus pacificus]|uniref:Uncharacterized protein n=1 Tax=Pristionchus pacificus TaxID=54126 RepID=A0A2A6CF59_PRIPA|nr:hypothetical protein PRIPAC_71328 [Pristionchus pacificus]|eukprot:PDM76730.1 hypothetical protein PRIPAC_42125 [Pristionchus pacificus]